MDIIKPGEHLMQRLVRKTPQSLVLFFRKAISVSWQLAIIIYATIDSGKTLPNPNSKKRKSTPEEALLRDNLFNEFGGTISREVLQYLVRWLGASKLTAARIRCLYQNGYLSLPQSVYSSAGLESSYKSAWNAVINHLDPNDLEGAWKDTNPDQVDPKTIRDPRYVSGAEHAGEVKRAVKSMDILLISLANKIDHLNRFISKALNHNAPDILEMMNQEVHLQTLQDAFTKSRNFVESKVAKGSPPPDTWSDEGQIPIIEDLLQVSSCKVPGAQYYK